MAFIGDTYYEVRPGREGRVVRRLAPGQLQVLGVRGRPDFASGDAMSLLAEWAPPNAARRRLLPGWAPGRRFATSR